MSFKFSGIPIHKIQSIVYELKERNTKAFGTKQLPRQPDCGDQNSINSQVHDKNGQLDWKVVNRIITVQTMRGVVKSFHTTNQARKGWYTSSSTTNWIVTSVKLYYILIYIRVGKTISYSKSPSVEKSEVTG